MDAVEILTQDLIDGSSELNRMQKEVDCVVGMLKGLVTSGERNALRDDHTGCVPIMPVVEIANRKSALEEITWCMQEDVTSSGLRLRIFCSRTTGNVWTRMYSSGPSVEMAAKDVVSVRRSLPSFVAGMFSLFPALFARTEPFQAAAKIAHARNR